MQFKTNGMAIYLLNFVYPSLQNSTTHTCAVTEDLFILNNALAKTTQIRNAQLPLTILPNHASTKSQINSKYKHAFH